MSRQRQEPLRTWLALQCHIVSAWFLHSLSPVAFDFGKSDSCGVHLLGFWPLRFLISVSPPIKVH